MKYTARHVKRFLAQGTIDPQLWADHFPTLLDTRVPACRDCEDFKKKICEGGRDPVDCFLTKTQQSGQQTAATAPEEPAGKKPELPEWGADDHRKRRISLADKTYDQSKM
jgi:hypothetical protein